MLVSLFCLVLSRQLNMSLREIIGLEFNGDMLIVIGSLEFKLITAIDTNAAFTD
jgi:hypothetical protein